MTIAIPSDILSEVLSAADPAAYRAAVERLQQMQPVPEPTFEQATAALNPPLALPQKGAPGIMRRSADGSTLSPYRKFEAFMLQTFVESMLPKNESLFGKGTAGSVWRSMLAEQIGNQLAAGGGIGIAKILAAAHPPDAPDAGGDNGKHPGGA